MKQTRGGSITEYEKLFCSQPTFWNWRRGR